MSGYANALCMVAMVTLFRSVAWAAVTSDNEYGGQGQIYSKLQPCYILES